MKYWPMTLISVFFSLTTMGAEVLIEDLQGELSSLETVQLESQLVHAAEIYSSLYGVRSKIRVQIAPEGCFRTGYSFADNAIRFCHGKNVARFGINSVDVIHHEVFHFLHCNQRKDLCTKEVLNSEEKVSILEALADLFAYRLKPDRFFGEELYSDRPYVREYSSIGCYDLLHGPYQKGTALFRELHLGSDRILSAYIKNGELSIQSLQQYGLIKGRCFAREFKLTVSPFGAARSSLNRYRVSPEGLRLQISGNSSLYQRFGNIKLSLLRSASAGEVFEFSLSGDTLLVVPKRSHGATKVVIAVHSGDEFITQIPLYLSVKK